MTENQRIELTIPVDYELSEFVRCCNAFDTSLLIDYGEKILKSHKKLVSQNVDSSRVRELQQNICDKDSKLDQLRKIINKAYREHEQKNREWGEVVDEVRSDAYKSNSTKLIFLSKTHAEEITLLNDKISKLYNDKQEEHINNLSIIDRERHAARDAASLEYKKIIERLEKERDDAILKLGDERKERDSAVKGGQNLILEKIDPLIKYLHCNSAIDKGNKGEHMIQQILIHNYNSAIVVDVSKKNHSGDIHMTLDSMQCLIEVKRKKNVSSEDVSKFINDIRTQHTQNSNINCALFLSLETENIPRKGSFYVEVINNIPVLYMYLYNIDYIKYAINILKSITHNISMKPQKEIISGEFQRIVKEVISNQYSTLTKEKKRINSVINQLRDTIKTLQTSHDKISKSLEQVVVFYDSNEDMRNRESKKETRLKIVAKKKTICKLEK